MFNAGRENVILHEYGAKTHYRALSDCGVEFEYVEFALVKMAVKGVLVRDYHLVLRQFRNFWALIVLLFVKDKNIVVGMAPFDIRVLYVIVLGLRNNIYYHTSWPFWDGSFHPKPSFFGFTRIFWRLFLNRSIVGVRTVTKKSAEEIIRFSNTSVNVSIVYHALGSEFFETPLRAHSFASEHLRFLFVGRVEPSKGSEEIKRLVSEMPGGNVFTVIGRGGAVFPSRVQRVGFVKGVKALVNYYDHNDILILPSKRNKKWEELFGMVIIEAMSRGLVVIASNHVGPSEIITNGVNGLLVSEENFVAEVMDIVNKFSVEDFECISKNAIEEAKKYSCENLFKRWEFPC